MSAPKESRLRPVNIREVRDRMTAEKLADYLRQRPDLTEVDRKVRFLMFKADQTLSASRAGRRVFRKRPSAYAKLLSDVFNAYIEFGEDLPPRRR